MIQELVDRPGWSSGNAVALIISGSGERVAESFDGNLPQAAPVLHVEFDQAAGSVVFKYRLNERAFSAIKYLIECIVSMLLLGTVCTVSLAIGTGMR